MRGCKHSEHGCFGAVVEGPRALSRRRVPCCTGLSDAVMPCRPRPDPVDFFACSGADQSILNADGKTALEVAQLNEQTDVIAALS